MTRDIDQRQPTDAHLFTATQKERLNGGEQSYLSSGKARAIIEGQFGKVVAAEPVTGGLVHYVYRVQGEQGNGIVKFRGTECFALPGEPTEPDEIEYEHRALQMLGAISPDTFPRVLAYDREAAMIVMSDIMPSRRTLEQRLNTGDVTPDELRALGKTVAEVHRKLATVDTTIREDDRAEFDGSLSWRLGYHNHPVLNGVVTEMMTQPRQMILGDLSPKNIGKGPTDKPTICDFEAVYQGSPAFPFGFLTGHVMIHGLKYFDQAATQLQALHQGFEDGQATVDLDSPLVKRLAIGAILYRMKNKQPYNCPLTPDERAQKADAAFGLLEKDHATWIDIAHTMTKGPTRKWTRP